MDEDSPNRWQKAVSPHSDFCAAETLACDSKSECSSESDLTLKRYPENIRKSEMCRTENVAPDLAGLENSGCAWRRYASHLSSAGQLAMRHAYTTCTRRRDVASSLTRSDLV